MNLWIILAITWISVSVVIADPGWFVHDTPFGGGGDEDLFSSENLLTITPKPKSKTVVPVKVEKTIEEKTKDTESVAHMTKAGHTSAKKPETGVEAEDFIPMHGPVRKPLSVKDETKKPVDTKLKPKQAEKRPSEPVIKPLPNKSKSTTWFVQDTSNHEDEDDLFSSEHLIAIKPKSNPKPKSAAQFKTKKETSKTTTTTTTPKPVTKTPVKKSTSSEQNVNSSNVESTGRKLLATSEKSGKTKSQSPNVSPPKIENEQDPCEDERDIDCLMETDELILVDKKKPKPKVENKPLVKKETVKETKPEEKKAVEKTKTKVTEEQKANIHRRLLDNDKATTTQPSEPELQPLLKVIDETDKEEEVEDDDVLAGEDGDRSFEEQIKRFRRQATEDDFGSGGGDFVSQQTIASEPEFSVGFQTTLNNTYDQPPTQAEQDAIGESLRNQLTAQFSNNSQFVEVMIRNVSLDRNGRAVVDWELVMRLSGATGDDLGTRSQAALDFIGDVVVPASNNLVVNGNPVYEPAQLDPVVVKAIATQEFGDMCNSVNACPDGYTCRNEGLIASCLHLCYATDLINQCQNGGSCQLNDTYQPYCQCGSGFTGDLCETATGQDDSYTPSEVAGAAAGAAVCALGALGCCFYLALFRKKKERDMEYSYFGDDDSSPAGYSDVSSTLDFSNYHIDRPQLFTIPQEMYGGGGYNA